MIRFKARNPPRPPRQERARPAGNMLSGRLLGRAARRHQARTFRVGEWERMSELSTRARSLREQGLQALREGDDTRAIDLLTRAVLTDERDAEARACLGIAYSRKGQHDPAVRLLREAVELSPESPNFRFNLGVALDRAGQTEAARAALADTLRLAPEHHQARQRLEALAPPPPPEPVAAVVPPAPVEELADPVTAPALLEVGFPEPSSSPSVMRVSPSLPALPERPPAVPDPARPHGYLRHRAGTIGAIGITGYLLLPFGLGCGLFGVVALVLGISAWRMGNRDLAAMDTGRMDPSGRSSTARGRTSGIVLTLLSLLDLLAFLVLLVALIASGKLPGMGNH